jgi:hypothetical protein
MCATKNQYESQKYRPSNQPCGCDTSTNGEGGSKNTFSRASSSADSKTGKSTVEAVATQTAKPAEIEYSGIVYRRNRRGYYVNQEGHGREPYLHRAVYKDAFGEIPKGHDIHHIDHDKSNNDISNLQCLTRSEHTRLHGIENQNNPQWVARNIEVLALMRSMSPSNNPPTLPCKCVQCGAEYLAHLPNELYCTDKCERTAFRARERAGKVERMDREHECTCIQCNVVFKANRSTTKVCSTKCHDKIKGERRKIKYANNAEIRAKQSARARKYRTANSDKISEYQKQHYRRTKSSVKSLQK